MVASLATLTTSSSGHPFCARAPAIWWQRNMFVSTTVQAHVQFVTSLHYFIVPCKKFEHFITSLSLTWNLNISSLHCPLHEIWTFHYFTVPYMKFEHFITSLSLTRNLGCLTWVRHSSCKNSTIPIPISVCSIFRCPKNGTIYGCQCLGFFMCAHVCWCMRLHTGAVQTP